MSLSNYTLEELQEEIKKRQLPAMLPQPDRDMSRLLEAVRDTVQQVADGTSPDMEYLAEVAIETMYGPNIWPWWNARLDDS